MWNALDLVRVYTKPKGRAPDYETPVVLKRGRNTVRAFCDSLHKCAALSRLRTSTSLADLVSLALSFRSIVNDFKSALVFGTSVKHSRGQHVGLDHVLDDEDLITIVRDMFRSFYPYPRRILTETRCFLPNSSSDSACDPFRFSLDNMYLIGYALAAMSIPLKSL
jgi:hypothetical protein